jgi:hypothetical protein
MDDVSSIYNDPEVELILFADDIKLYSTYDLRGSKSDLATAVDHLFDWSCTWQLQIANEKRFVITIY